MFASSTCFCQQCGYISQSHAAYLLMYMKQKEQQPAKTECFEHSSNRCMIISLPDTLLLVVASYLVPPDVYSLAQTCKKFHTPSTELSTRHFLSPPQVKPLDFMQNNEVTNLASRLLQDSLIHGFTSVIQHATSINKARRIVKFQEDELSMDRKVLLSGSAAVQALTGKRFEEFDLNFFCNRPSAVGFRQLMRDLGYCCESVVPHYCEHAEQYHYCGGHIHHVVNFIPRGDIETVAMSTLVGEYYRAWNAQLAAVEADEEVPHELEHIDMSFLNHRNRYLYEIQKNSQYRFPRDYPIALSPPNNFAGSDDADTRYKCKNGSIQLVVCWTCPMLAIAKYDMDICKSRFDGKQVHIVSINDTFNFRTKSDDHMKFINFYVPEYLSSAETTYETINTLTHVSVTKATIHEKLRIIYCVMKTAKNVDRHTQLTVLGANILALLSSRNIDLLHNDIVRLLLLHNNIVRLLQRAIKYFDRGIDVPLSDNVKVLLGYSSIHQHHQDVFATPSKRKYEASLL